MSLDQAVAQLTSLLWMSLAITLPVLLASLVSGVLVGVIQTATQVNEPSVGFLVKLLAVVAVCMLTGPRVGAAAVTYTRECFMAIPGVVR